MPADLLNLWQFFDNHDAFAEFQHRIEAVLAEKALALREEAPPAPITERWQARQRWALDILARGVSSLRAEAINWDKVTASYTIRHIGFAKLAANELADAKKALAESLDLREEAGFTPGIAFALAALAHVDALEGDKAQALSRLERSRTILESLEATSRIAWIDEQIASLE